jgi:asparagine synthase (glutamine-hydrolysing)
MCGIAGYWDVKHSDNREQLQSVVAKMRDTLMHRGPDSAGLWVDEKTGIAFGHRRLAILDLSEHGHQPMSSASQRFVISYNGEIYNNLEIKQQLTTAGLAPVWRGHSDTEVILAAFEAWGIAAALEKMVGMFAIALWDKQEHLLYLIRDRIGEKPLYYGWVGDYLLFGSELKALKLHHAWQQSINRDALGLLMRYNCIPAPFTIYENIYKLEPGHMLIVNSDRTFTKHKYWDLKAIINDPQTKNNFATPAEAVDSLEAILSQAIKQQMLADVPLGAFLSGGIDSSTVVALMQAQSSNPVKTFTIGFADANFNEAEQAKKIAKHLNTDHTELYLSAEQTRAIIPDLSTFYDEPFADSSQVPTYILAKMTRQHVKVSLSGDGGDELFAGYNRYSAIPSIWNKIRYFPLPLRNVLAKIMTSLPTDRWDKIFASLSPLMPTSYKHASMGAKMHKAASVLDAASKQDMYFKLISHWYDKEAVVPNARKSTTLLKDLTKDLDSKSLVDSMMYMDTQRYLPDDILVKVDRAAMAVSLETRIPFLDHRVVAFAWSLPADLKLRNGQSKWLVRQLLQRYVPADLFERPKMGFGVPIGEWLRGPLKEWAHDLLSDSMLAKHQFLDAKLVQKKWQQHLAGTFDWQYHLWDVLMFQSWYEANHG